MKYALAPGPETVGGRRTKVGVPWHPAVFKLPREEAWFPLARMVKIYFKMKDF